LTVVFLLLACHSLSELSSGHASFVGSVIMASMVSELRWVKTGMGLHLEYGRNGKNL